MDRRRGPRVVELSDETGNPSALMTFDRIARAFSNATIVPLHFEGWEHFSEGREDIVRAFAAPRVERRLFWPIPPERECGPRSRERDPHVSVLCRRLLISDACATT